MAEATMLRCALCHKPVMLLTPEQAARVEADPARFDFICTGCPEPTC
jgi:hypothetical protein